MATHLIFPHWPIGSAVGAKRLRDPPSGPSVMVLPGTNKTFDQFREDGAVCQQHAQQAIGAANPQQDALDSGTKSAVVGTVIGATAGAISGALRHV